MKRRSMLKLSALIVGAGATAASAHAACETDGTPAQFVPKTAPDPKAQERDIEKYPKCPYCGMDRKQFHHSRMLVQYSDDLPDATCSIHCAALSLAVNVDREPKIMYVADNAAKDEVKPLIEVDKATFLIGSGIKGVMTRRSKVAFASEEAAKAALAKDGGELGNFDKALLASYTDMAEDVRMIRKNREERRKRAQQQKQG